MVSQAQISVVHHSKMRPWSPLRGLKEPSFWANPDFLDSFSRSCFAKGLKAALLALLEAFQPAALTSLRSMMRLMMAQ
jgi:hypothetical protein